MPDEQPVPNNDEQKEPKIEGPKEEAQPETPEAPETEALKELPEKEEKLEIEDMAPVQATNSKPKGKFKRFGHWYKTHKKISIPLTILLVIAVLMAIPFTRYKILGLFWKQSIEISVQDSQTSQPVTEASVAVAGQSASTDSKGIAHLSKVAVGPHSVSVTKKYYKDSTTNITVKLQKPTAPFGVKLEATGRQIPMTVTNKITGKPVENVLIKTLDVQARSDKDGKATLVVPADQAKVTLTLTADGYNQQAADVEVSAAIATPPSFQMVPSGKVYFLSKKSGKVDVVKTNLDGTERQVVLAGTGKEDTPDTILLASRDWKFLALKSKRDGGANAKLFLIDTSNDKVTTMDEGDAHFTFNGWTDHQFVYTVSRNNVQTWEAKQTALKSYNADSKQIVVLDETQGAGTSYYNYAAESISNIYVLPSKVVYSKVWSQNNSFDPANRKSQIISVDPNGKNKSTLKDFPTTPTEYVTYMDAKLYAPDEIYYQVGIANNPNSQFYEYEDNKVATTTGVTQDTFNKFYPTYLLSPSGKNTFWYEPRDGKNTLFVGDADGKNEKQIASLSEYTPYGWFTDDYLFVSKGGSELYILPKDGGQVLKVTDYHKPSADFTGYGGGYGGF